MIEPLRMSVAQVAIRWGCSRKHVYNLVHRGELPALYIGELIRFRREDVEAYENRSLEPKSNLSAPERKPHEAPGMGNKSPGYLAGLKVATERVKRKW